MRTAYIVVVFTIFIGTYGVGTVCGSTPEYLGEFCWEASGGPDYISLGITYMGGENFAVNGCLFETSGNTNLVSGTGRVVGSDFHIHFSTSGIYTTDIVSYVGTMVLNLNTLDGYIEGVGVNADRTTSQSWTNYDGTMLVEYIACP